MASFSLSHIRFPYLCSYGNIDNFFFYYYFLPGLDVLPLPTTPSTKEHVLANYKKSKNYTDTRPSATARSIAGGTVGRLELDREPQMHIIEERSNENPKLHRS